MIFPFLLTRLVTLLNPQIKEIKKLNPELRINCFGHIGDGNLHYNVFPPKGKINKQYFSDRDKLRNIINEECHNCKGSISAEHGIGRLKVEELKKYGDKGKLSSMSKISLDPVGLLNPSYVPTIKDLIKIKKYSCGILKKSFSF